ANLQTAVESGALEQSRRLVLLERRVPIEMDWEAWRLQDWDATKLLALFREWGFRGFADEVRKAVGSEQLTVGSASATAPPQGEALQGELFPFGANHQPV